MSNVIRFPSAEEIEDDPISLADIPAAEVYTVAEAAARLGISKGLTYELVRGGEIPAKRLGRRWVVPRAPFHAWLNDAPKGA